ncbi:GNAT family N-acetyltransferase [Hafnia alvei]|uniref:Putative acetyltransferase n=1 Tax=Hafnia alvei TaxID=569 RepID=A0A1C6Z6K3_HAFAL|nr:N-acetyltransferase [Hafnia alvei]NLS55845.1 GNAT family N-acetyltransferase [Hafnia alvei]SCM54753.1 putative acetyltransferase [Hafnia alvei]
MTITLRHETPQDIDTIESVTASAFLNAEHTDHNEHLIVNALRNAGALTLSLVALDAQRIVGHASISSVIISSGDSGWYGLAPVSVVPDYQGRGIGSALVEQILSELKSLDAAGCVVLGDPAFYGRFGFVADDSLVLPGVPAEYFQALAFKGRVPVGDVEFHPAFSATN